MTQVGHMLMGTALGIVSLPAQASLQWKAGHLAAFALLALVPDLPLPWWGHERYDISHSLFVNLLLILIAVALLALPGSIRERIGGRVVLMSGVLAWLSHLLLDSFYNHGLGVAIFWPLSSAQLALPIPWFSVVPMIPPITLAHLWEYGAEFISYGPLVAAAYLLHRKRIRQPLVRPTRQCS